MASPKSQYDMMIDDMDPTDDNKLKVPRSIVTDSVNDRLRPYMFDLGICLKLRTPLKTFFSGME